MKNYDVVFVGFQISKEGWELLDKVQHAITKLVEEAGYKKDIHTVTFDLVSYEADRDVFEDSWTYVYGETAKKNLKEQPVPWTSLPAIKDILSNPEIRREANDKLKDSIPELVKWLNRTPVEEVKTCVETPSGLTVGTTGCDFCVTEKEAEYLKKILDILGGGKMVITKGDLRIEVEK
jgi:hypothetical protein